MSPADQKIIAAARRRVNRSRFAILFLVIWIVTLGVLLRLGRDEQKKAERQPLALQKPCQDKATHYFIAASCVFLSGVVLGSLFASSADRLLVRISDEKMKPNQPPTAIPGGD